MKISVQNQNVLFKKSILVNRTYQRALENKIINCNKVAMNFYANSNKKAMAKLFVKGITLQIK